MDGEQVVTLSRFDPNAPPAMIDVALVDHPSPFQPRKNFLPDSIKSMAESIRIHGLLQPIIVRSMSVGNPYQLIIGERRLRAVKLIAEEDGLHTTTMITAKILYCDDDQAADLCAIENGQREDLLPSEIVEQMRILTGRHRTVSHISELLGRRFSEANVRLWIEAMSFSAAVLQMLDARQISKSMIPIISRIDGVENQERAAELVRDGGLSANQLKARTQHFPQKVSRSAESRKSAHVNKEMSEGDLIRTLLQTQRVIGSYLSSRDRVATTSSLRQSAQNLIRTLQDIVHQ